MDPFEHNNLSPTALPSRRSIWLAGLIVGVQILISLISYPFLPNQVPSHWNAAGQITSYMPKLLNAVLWPVLSIGIYALVIGLVLAGPKLGRANQRTAVSFTERILVSVLLLLLGIQLLIVAAALKLPVDTTFVITLLVSLLFIFIGNFLGKLRRNFWAGIRTPWTLAGKTYHKDYFIRIDQGGIFINPALLAFAA